MSTYNELFKLGFGLKELKQLLNTLMEICLANNILVSNALPKFLKDVEEQYDDKLGFENAINNLQAEKEKPQAEVPEYQWYLQLQGVVGPIIYYLNSNGVTNEDIINLNSLVLSFKNSNFIDDIAHDEGGNNKTKRGTISINKFWKLFIEKIKSLKNIHLEINERLSISNNLKIQIDRLNKKKQETEKTLFRSNF